MISLALLRIPSGRRLWRVAILVAGLQSSVAQAQLTQLYAFQYDATTTSNYPNGENPLAELIQGADGNYYTTTQSGGSGACPGTSSAIPGCGAIVKITPEGVLSVLYSFPYDSGSNSAPNGVNPQAGLLQGPDGNFYGVAAYGGTGGNFCGTIVGISGCGTVFRVTPSGSLTTLRNFCGGNGCGSFTTDGAVPVGRLAIGPNGNFYGTTQSGGIYNGVYNSGTIFQISATGSSYTLMHIFSGNSGTGDGANPAAGLTLASNGDFYGTTEFGGASGFGTVFRMELGGTVTIMHSFAQYDLDGAQPMGALIEASDGNLYGTCYSGGANNVGTVFRISKANVFEKIYDFTQAAGNVGNLPKAGVIQASDGNLYGTTWEGGLGTGSIYQLTLAGVATLEANFDPNSPTGYYPVGALVQGSDGKMYVTAPSGGGTNSDGVPDQGTIDVFNASLPPPKPGILGFVPSSGKVGTKVTIGLGPYIGATSVKFNGTSAKFKVPGSEFITATVPVGATSGPISVTTPGGTTKSKGNFTVLP